MKTADLTGPLLDYHVARAEGVPAADLEFRATGSLCVRVLRNGPAGIDGVMVLDYSTNPALWAPLILKHGNRLEIDVYGWYFRTDLAPVGDLRKYPCSSALGPLPEMAICRAVVRAAFGDEVEDLPC